MNRTAPHTPPTIVLMGLRGSGKSTIGRLLAAALGRPFIDLDDRTPALLGCATPADAIQSLGLRAFRDAECQALETVLNDASETPIVLAESAGHDRIAIAYLHATPRELRDRLASTDTATRPSLTGGGMLDEIETIYLQRDADYRELATAMIETADADERQVADAIVAIWG